MANEIAAPREFNHQDCLDTNPFEGDFGEQSDDREFSNKIVIARKGGTCHLCADEIQPGHPTRVLVAKHGGEMRRYRWCHICCQAMAASWEDDGDAWNERAMLGWKRRMKTDD